MGSIEETAGKIVLQRHVEAFYSERSKMLYYSVVTFVCILAALGCIIGFYLLYQKVGAVMDFGYLLLGFGLFMTVLFAFFFAYDGMDAKNKMKQAARHLGINEGKCCHE